MFKAQNLLSVLIAIVFLIFPIQLDVHSGSEERVQPEEVINRLTNRIISFPQEKVYLHTDKSIYGLGENIWFKAYLIDAATHQKNTPSSLMHVALKNPEGNIVRSLNIKMEDGWDRGNMMIGKTWLPGKYTLLAYTDYMCNYDHAYLFQKSIYIGDAFRQINVDQSEVETVTMKFYPEGGELVSGISGTLGFTAFSESGQPLELKGVITDDDGNEVTALTTYTPGFGRTNLVPKDGKYKAKIQYNNKQYEFDLPEVSDKGYGLSVNNRNVEYHIVTVSASDKMSLDDVYVLAHVRGVPVALIEDMEGNKATFKISKKGIPDGIMHVTLFDDNARPWCERLVNTDHPDNQISTDISIPYSHFKQRQRASVNISLLDIKDKAVDGDLSVSITDTYSVPVSEYGLNIKNYLLMLSDLENPVAEPGYYLGDDSKSRYFQDLVLLTHGWRRFTWKDVIKEKEPTLNYPPRSGFDLRGSISKNNKPIESDMTISLIGEDLQLLESASDKNGNFNLYEVAIWDTTDVVFQANDKKNKKIKKAEIELVQQERIPVDSDNIQPVIKTDEDALRLYLEATLENERLDSFYRTEFTIDLDEVTVTSTRADVDSRLKKERKMPYSEVDNRLLLDSLRFIQPYYTVFEIVRLTVPGVQVVGTPGVDQEFRIRGQSSLTLSNAATVLINGVQASNGAVNALRAADIEFIDVLKGLSKTAVYGELGGNGIIAIYTKSGRTPPRRNKKIEGLFNIEHPGYYKAREFASPDYSTFLPVHKKPDLRTTLYWSPDVEVDEEGAAVLNFYTADRNTTYRIDLQGISTDGRPIQKVYFFDVKED